MSSVDTEKLEEKIGEAIGLEMAAQKAVEELSSKGLIPNQGLAKLQGMRKEANNHQTQMEDLVRKLSQSDGLDSAKVQEMAQETEQKASK
jgi:Asp-tRNA(Asn)/Glu-tRNA(Gln) amidotransferase C subunit